MRHLVSDQIAEWLLRDQFDEQLARGAVKLTGPLPSSALGVATPMLDQAQALGALTE
jgi:hypothetical protein